MGEMGRKSHGDTGIGCLGDKPNSCIHAMPYRGTISRMHHELMKSSADSVPPDAICFPLPIQLPIGQSHLGISPLPVFLNSPYLEGMMLTSSSPNLMAMYNQVCIPVSGITMHRLRYAYHDIILIPNNYHTIKTMRVAIRDTQPLSSCLALCRWLSQPGPGAA